MPLSAFALLTVLVVSAVGTVLALWWERRRPSSYTHQRDALAAWRAQPSEVQAAYDEAALNAGAAAEAAAARTHFQYRP